MWRIVLLLGVLIGLNSCASLEPDQSAIQAPPGIAAGSVTYSGRYSKYRVMYRQLPKGVSGSFEYGDSGFPPPGDFKDRTLRGAVFAENLPAGEYEIYRWHIRSGLFSVESTNPFSIRFRIDPTKVIYLGNFHFTVTRSLGLSVTGATLTYKDAIGRDLPVLKEKFPGVSEQSIAYALTSGTEQENLGGSHRTTFTPIFVPYVRFR